VVGSSLSDGEARDDLCARSRRRCVAGGVDQRGRASRQTTAVEVRKWNIDGATRESGRRTQSSVRNARSRSDDAGLNDDGRTCDGEDGAFVTAPCQTAEGDTDSHDKGGIAAEGRRVHASYSSSLLARRECGVPSCSCRSSSRPRFWRYGRLARLARLTALTALTAPGGMRNVAVPPRPRRR